MAAAISSYLSACSASLAFCTSSSRSTILDVCVVVLCVSELIKSYCVQMWKLTVLALQLLIAVCATADGTPPPPPSDFPRSCRHPDGRGLERWRQRAGRSVADCLITRQNTVEGHKSHSYILCVQEHYDPETKLRSPVSVWAGLGEQRGICCFGVRPLVYV